MDSFRSIFILVDEKVYPAGTAYNKTDLKLVMKNVFRPSAFKPEDLHFT